jgi:signal transduction histidine kinase
VKRPGAGRLRDLARLLAAAVLLTAVGVVTVRSVTSATRTVDERRLADRLALTQAFAASLSQRLADGQQAATRVAQGGDPAHVPGWDALVLDGRLRVVAASPRFQNLIGIVPSRPCPADPGLADVVAAATRSPAPVVREFDAPGSCIPVVGAVARASERTAVASADVSSLMASIAPAAHLQTGIRTLVVDPAGTVLVPGQPPSTIPPYLAPFLRRVSGRPAATGRYAIGGARDSEVVGAYAPVVGGWSVVIEQDAATFDVGPESQPPRVAAVILAASFAIALVLLAFFDARRRRAARLADAHRDAFLAIVGHELRTPLTVLKGFVDTLSSRWGDLEDGQRHLLVERLQPQTRRLHRVVERLLLAAGIQAGARPRASRQPVELRPALERVAEHFAPLAPLHRFQLDVAPDLGVVGDPRSLDQVLDQLVDNAVKFSPTGGIVRLAGVRRHRHVEVSVEDDGVGLPSDTGSLFDAFVQAEDVEGRVHAEGGVGVGLYIARTLVSEMGGTLRAERRAGAGSRFVVTLPAAERIAAVASPVGRQ